ncbi:transmembrane protein 199 [Sitophilus oryzae]|uniref:Transmembrane protein 199 n=1 Tax=Sitophilus oryzae TaxID=7048 RepID=A0A6J2YGV2_SITOR|nr:transmembrane protein 199 [Sitophilus oryzae]
MSSNVGQIGNPQIFVIPSNKLRNYISNIRVGGDMPAGIKNVVFKNKTNQKPTQKHFKIEYLVTEEDKRFIKALTENRVLDSVKSSQPELKVQSDVIDTNSKLSLEDLHWLYKYIAAQNRSNEEKVYLHELIESSEILLPKNVEIPRNEELEKRCQKLKEEQQNQEYKNMIRNVDNNRRTLPEDTIGYQLRMMNQHLIAIFQFIISVAAAFAFGFVGIELLTGSLDFGFRLLLGIICGLIVAIAELYFLAKKLNEDLEFEYASKKTDKKVN